MRKLVPSTDRKKASECFEWFSLVSNLQLIIYMNSNDIMSRRREDDPPFYANSKY